MKALGRAGCAVQVLVCGHERPPEGLPCCRRAGGDAVLAAVRAEVARRGLRVQVWVAQTSCMGWCSAEGVTLTFWPKGAFYQGVKVEDVAGLCALHLEPSRG